MGDRFSWETLKGEGQALVDKLKAVLHEGNIRRVVVQHKGQTIAEFPVTAGIVGAPLAPVVAAIGAIVVMLKDCTIQIERVDRDVKVEDETRASAV